MARSDHLHYDKLPASSALSNCVDTARMTGDPQADDASAEVLLSQQWASADAAAKCLAAVMKRLGCGHRTPQGLRHRYAPRTLARLSCCGMGLRVRRCPAGSVCASMGTLAAGSAELWPAGTAAGAREATACLAGGSAPARPSSVQATLTIPLLAASTPAVSDREKSRRTQDRCRVARNGERRWPSLAQPLWISMRLRLACSGLGTRTVRTPSSRVAWTSSLSLTPGRLTW
jgi:hypothetical protein